MGWQINATDIPAYARPKGRGYEFILPETSGFTGEGEPCGAVGRPSVRISFERCSADCWNYWRAWTGESLSATLTSIQLFNPWKSGGADFEEYTGGAIIHRPTVSGISMGAFEGVEILITEIQ